ncbi:MAG: alpha-L-fucosidase [Bacteroidota bacterium]
MKNTRRSFVYQVMASAAGIALGNRLIWNIGSPKDSSSHFPGPAGNRDTLSWWQDAKFGLFIHWGLASKAGGDWKGKETGNIGMMMNEKIPVKEYEAFAAEFLPDSFNAETWVLAAKQAGMKYIIYVAKHHDGFAMYGSKASPFNIVDHTAWKRDPLKEIAIACRKHDIRLGIYYSLGRDWHDPNVPTKKGGWRSNTWDYPDEKNKKLEVYLANKAIPQVKELLTDYGPVFSLWFDTPEMVTPEQSKILFDMVRSLQPDCIINDRVGNGLADYKTVEQKLSNQVMNVPWEACMTMNARSWGYNRHDTNWKSPKALVSNLIDIVSKGGNLLLNVGPTGRGEFQQAELERLQEIGNWLKVNGESVYSAQRTPFGIEFEKSVASSTRGDELNLPEEIKVMDKSLDEHTRNAQGGWAWRCTKKNGKLYFHLFQWPEGKFVLPVDCPVINKAYLLGDSSGKKLTVRADGNSKTIVLPSKAPDSLVPVLCCEIDENKKPNQ